MPNSSIRDRIRNAAWIGCLLVVPVLSSAQNPDSGPETRAEVPTPFPKTVLRVNRVKRLDEGHVVVFVGIEVLRDGKPTFIGYPPKPGEAPPPGMNSLPGVAPAPRPYSLETSSLTIDSRVFPLSKPSPYVAPELCMTLNPGQAVELPIEFDAPSPPPPDPNGKRPPLSAVLSLPNDKSIPNLLIPSDIDSRTSL